jgi:hypothetical protein
MRIPPWLCVLALGAMAATVAGAGEPAHQSRSPEAPPDDLPDMRQLQRDFGYGVLAREVARVVAETGGDAYAASRRLQEVMLSEVTFPLEVRGRAAAWFDVVSPLQDVDVGAQGLRGIWGSFPTNPLRRDRMALECVDDSGAVLPHRLVLGGPEEILFTGQNVLYTVDGLDACWLDGGARLLVHDVDEDPLVALGSSEVRVGDMADWGREFRSDRELSISVLGSLQGDETGFADVFADGDIALSGAFGEPGDLGSVGSLNPLDCSVGGPCPTGVACLQGADCSCDDRGNIVTVDLDRDGCPEQRTAWIYDDAGRARHSDHDWDNDGDSDERCTYTPPCRPRDGDCKRSCAEFTGR